MVLFETILFTDKSHAQRVYCHLLMRFPRQTQPPSMKFEVVQGKEYIELQFRVKEVEAPDGTEEFDQQGEEAVNNILEYLRVKDILSFK